MCMTLKKVEIVIFPQKALSFPTLTRDMDNEGLKCKSRTSISATQPWKVSIARQLYVYNSQK